MHSLEAVTGTHPSLLAPVGELLHAHLGRYSVEQLLVGGGVVLATIWGLRKLYQGAMGE